MKSKVYFVRTGDSDDIRAVTRRLEKLLEESRLLGFLRKNYKVAVKAHFGEKGNTGFVRPEYVGIICGKIMDRGAAVFLADTNTLYRGQRTNSADHLKLAHEHGFTKRMTGAEVVIPDDSKKEDRMDVKIDQRLIKKAKLARLFVDADSIIAVNHFKGHMLTGFGGALKNIGMGCATREGKLAQHCDLAPAIYKERCAGCGACIKVCPAGALRLEKGKAAIDISKCIGCASCMAVCATMAIFIDMDAGDIVQEKMVEYASAVLAGKDKRAGFINFAVRINKECDCWGMENPKIAPDVGIFASDDPVSIDKASFDLVKEACGRDIFKENHPGHDGARQLEYAHEIGLGNLDYELIEL